MNKIILLAIFVFTGAGLFAQSDTIALAVPGQTSTADLDDPDSMPNDITGHGTITNNSSETKIFVWKRTLEIVPDGWTTAICDVNLCYFPTVDSMEFQLAGEQVGTMDVHAYPGGSPGGSLDGVMPGTASAEITIYEVADPSNSESGIWTFELFGTPVGVDEIEAARIHLFPNPAHNYFYLSNSQELSQVQVYNVLGKEMFRANSYENKRFDISDFSSGIYFVRLIDDEGKIAKTIKLQKR